MRHRLITSTALTAALAFAGPATSAPPELPAGVATQPPKGPFITPTWWSVGPTQVRAIRVRTRSDGEPVVEDVELEGRDQPLLEHRMRAYLERPDATVSLFRVPPNVRFEPHNPPDGLTEVFFILDGSAIMHLPDGRRREVGTGTIVILETVGGRPTGAESGPRGYLALNIAYRRESPDVPRPGGEP
jgi:mannose-6-phosphate isomerase-like protein (cupin superfamily)